MKIKIERNPFAQIDDTAWTEIQNVIQPINIVLRGDRELDGASFSYYTTNGELYSPLAGYRLTLLDDEGELMEQPTEWFGFEQNAKISPAMWKVTVTLSEVTKIAEAYLLDGFAVTNSLTDDTQQQNLLAVLQRILKHTPAMQQDVMLNNEDPANLVVTKPVFLFASEDTDTSQEISQTLASTTSPEFRFNTQTTLWEALLDIGNCIGALPRIRFAPTVNGERDAMFHVHFYFINRSSGTVASIGSDSGVITSGAQINPEQYNSQLSLVADNVIEE